MGQEGGNDNFQYSYCDYLTDNQEITGCPQPGEEKEGDENLGYCAYVREAKRLSGCDPRWGKGFANNNPKRNAGIIKAPFGPQEGGNGNFQYSYCDYLTDNQEITGCPQPGEEKEGDENLGYC